MNKNFTLLFELTNNCNAHCITCLTHIMKRKRGYMHLETFVNTLSQARNLDIEAIQLNGQGEGMLHSKWINFSILAKDFFPHIRVQTITNGSIYRKIPDELDAFDISFNAGTKETYERITKLSFDKTISNINKWREDEIFYIDFNIYKFTLC